nr:unnamed protein product [Digitaria exilis]
MAHFGGASNATGRHGHRGRPCSYLAIMAKVAVASFNHSGIWKTYNDMYRSGHVPAVMNWKAHRTGSCTEAQRNACSYPCISGNSVCVDSSVGQGYRCRCSKGYEGNPYVPNGCQDLLIILVFSITGATVVILIVVIIMATNNFDEVRKLGGGANGTVYKGLLCNNLVVAIKRSKDTAQQQIKDFINEIAILSQINHRNVVRLLGCCLEAQVPMLIYEFVSNGTLSQHLFTEGIQFLPWTKRLHIAAGVANALAYLHTSASTSVIHRDIKSDNILLDEHLVAKVADFGASRGIPTDQSGVITRVQGTRGYLDPEYFYSHRLTKSSDVYSFGAVLLELLTSQRPYNLISDVALVSHFPTVFSEGRLEDILDPRVLLEDAESATAVARMVVSCLSTRVEDRPTMLQSSYLGPGRHAKANYIVSCKQP